MTTATAVRPDRQQAFEEILIPDPDGSLEVFLEQYLRLKTAAALTNKPYRRAHKELKKRFAEKALDKRLRIGAYVIMGLPIEGGDMEIPAWKSVRLKVEQA